MTDYRQGRMSMRRLSVLVNHLPDGGHVWAKLTKEQPGWSLEALLLADVFAALTGKTHPARERSEIARTASGRHVADVAAKLKARRDRRNG